jgi:simple sugar transport system permease protein
MESDLTQPFENATAALASPASMPSVGNLVRRPEMGSLIGLVAVFTFFSIFGGETFVSAGGAAS